MGGALHHSASSEIAAHALMVDAKDKAAVAFYRDQGFIALPDSPRALFLPLATVRRTQSRTAEDGSAASVQ